MVKAVKSNSEVTLIEVSVTTRWQGWQVEVLQKEKGLTRRQGYFVVGE